MLTVTCDDNYICDNDTNTGIMKDIQYNSVINERPNEQEKDIKRCFIECKNIGISSDPISDQYTSVSNTLRDEPPHIDKQNGAVKKVIRKNSRNNNVSFSDDEVAPSPETGVATSQQSMLPLIEQEANCPNSIHDSDTLCGLSATCTSPRLQSLATKKMFLLFFCIALVLQGMYYTYFVSVLTTIEKLFQIRSQTTGIIMSASEAGQIIGGLVLPYYGGRGNRPKWIAGGIITFSIGTLLSATPQLYLHGNYLADIYSISDNSSSGNSANTCSYTSAVHNDSSSADFSCRDEDKSAFFILSMFFISLLAVGIGHTTVQNLGFPYLDDNVNAEESPSYFGIIIGVRIFGPTFGFIFGSFCMRFYINPFQEVDFEPTDPRWLGAWWLGIIFISMALFAISLIVALFPKRLPTKECTKYDIVNGTKEQNINSLSTLQNDKYCYNQKSPTVYSQCKNEYIYSKPEETTTMMDETPRNISINYIQPSRSNVDDNSTKDGFADTICFPIVTKISICLPSKFLKHDGRTEMKPEKAKRKTDFWPTILRLLKNKVFLLRTASSVLHLLPIAGLYTFLPKYLETQFNLTVHSAAMISGVGGILVMGVGIASSGYVIRKLKLSPTKVAAWIALSALLYSIGMFILMFVGCPMENYGVYNDDRQISLCETFCHNCDRSLFAPMCASDGNSYFSACSSGCSVVNPSNDTNGLLFSHCDCLPAGVTATLGKCDSSCQNLILYISIFCIFVFIHSTSEVGAMMITMRCVDQSEKAMALGLISAAVGLFGNVPCPILYGSVIDYSCLVWKNSCDGSGACQLYDSDDFRRYFHGTTGALMLLAFIVDLFVVKYSKRVKFEDASANQETKILNHNT